MALSTITNGRRALLFDVDGTLADTIGTITAGLGDAYERFTGQRPKDDTLATLIGRSLNDQMSLFGLGERDPGGLPERVEYTLMRFRAHKDKSSLFQPAIAAWKHAMSLGWRTALVTSKDANELHDFLQDFPILRHSDACVCASDVANPKPAPDSALLACELLGVSPSEAIMVGDSLFDLACGRSAGLACIAVCYGAAKRSDLESHHPDLLIDTPEQLLAWA